jgi:hypothetical protein
VVGVGVDLAGDGPGLLPGEPLVVHEDSHELGDTEGGMGVVELDGDLEEEVRGILGVVAGTGCAG